MKAYEINGQCSKCTPNKCKCHPCYPTTTGNCNKCETSCSCKECTPLNTTATPISYCGMPEYCNDGCLETISSDCIIMPDGTTLTETINNIVNNCCTTCDNPAGTSIGSITICRD